MSVSLNRKKSSEGLGVKEQHSDSSHFEMAITQSVNQPSAYL